jgi:N-methylhydantoinase A
MADGIRLVSINRGYDPREFVLVPLGGAGGIHAVALAAELGILRILVPRFPGVLAAAGLLAAPIEHEVSGAFHAPLAKASIDEVRRFIAGLEDAAEKLMQAEMAEGLPRERQTLADIAYMGQSHHIEVPFEPGAPDALDRAYRAFETAHERVNGLKTGAPAKLVNLRVVLRALSPAMSVGADPGSEHGRSLKTHRRVLFPGDAGWAEAAVLDRARLGAGETVSGPAIIEQEDSTTLLPPGWRATVIAGAALIVERG